MATKCNFSINITSERRCKVSPSLQASHLICMLKIKFSFQSISLGKKYSVACGIILRYTQLNLQMVKLQLEGLYT